MQPPLQIWYKALENLCQWIHYRTIFITNSPAVLTFCSVLSLSELASLNVMLQWKYVFLHPLLETLQNVKKLPCCFMSGIIWNPTSAWGEEVPLRIFLKVHLIFSASPQTVSPQVPVVNEYDKKLRQKV